MSSATPALSDARNARYGDLASQTWLMEPVREVLRIRCRGGVRGGRGPLDV
jgi:hypothetical protein